MRKRDEICDPSSCFNRAGDDEILFVLRSHDVAAPDIIRYWTRKRQQMGKNIHRDAQIQEALQCASNMEDQRKTLAHIFSTETTK